MKLRFFFVLFLLIATELSTKAQLTAQMVKTCQAMGMQQYTITVQYTYLRNAYALTTYHDGRPINGVWRASVSYSADFFMMPGDPLKNMAGLSADNLIRWTASGSASIVLDSGCNASTSISSQDEPRLSFTYRNDKSWIVSASIQQKHPESNKDCVVQPFGSLGFDASNSSLDRNGVQGFSLSGNYIHDTSSGGHRETIQGNISLTVAPAGPPEQWEALIVPLNKSGYTSWLPLGPPVDGSYNKGNTIGFTISIRQKKDSNILYPLSYTVDWSLHDVTTNEGYCGNYPAKGANNDTKPDFRFDDSVYKYNKAVSSIADDKLSSLKDQGMAVPAILTCFDYGAYGLLQARVTLNDGTVLDAFGYRNHDKASIPIPCDDNGNKVADYYEKQHKVYDKNYSADWDAEKLLENTSSKGDGLTFFEEYRGFVLEDGKGNHVHQRLAPDTAEIFYHTMYGSSDDFINLVKGGAKAFGQAANVRMIYIKDGTLLGKEDNGEWPIRRVNFNNCLADKYHIDAIVVKTNTDGDKRTMTWPISGNELESVCPAEVDYIKVADKTFDDELSWLPPAKPVSEQARSYRDADSLLKNFTGIDVHFASLGNFVASHTEQLRKNYQIFAIMHEFGHATGMRHHQVDQYIQDDSANRLEHSTALQVGEFLNKVKENANDAGIGQTIDQIIAAVYKVAGYKQTGSWNYYASGDGQCPMCYWATFVHPLEILAFLSGSWNPSTNAPLITKWRFCDINQKEMHLHP